MSENQTWQIKVHSRCGAVMFGLSAFGVLRVAFWKFAKHLTRMRAFCSYTALTIAAMTGKHWVERRVSLALSEHEVMNMKESPIAEEMRFLLWRTNPKHPWLQPWEHCFQDFDLHWREELKEPSKFQVQTDVMTKLRAHDDFKYHSGDHILVVCEEDMDTLRNWHIQGKDDHMDLQILDFQVTSSAVK